jgi:hypothetical protein
MRVVVVPSLVESNDEFKAISQEEAAADGKGGELLALLLLLLLTMLVLTRSRSAGPSCMRG